MSYTIIEAEHAADMITVECPSSASHLVFGTSATCSPGVDVILQKDGEEHYCFVSREDWEAICVHLIETDLYPDRSYAWQVSQLRVELTHVEPRGAIFPLIVQGRYQCARFWLAKMMRRPIFTRLEMTDGSTYWERWS